MKRFKEDSAAASLGSKGGGEPKSEEPTKKKPKSASPKPPLKPPLEDGMFKTCNLRELEVPQSAWPQASRPHLGAHGYTVVAANGAVVCPKKSECTPFK